MNQQTRATLHKASLYFTEGGSDKCYHAEIVEVEGGNVVNFRYGRRGAALTSGCKTPAPVDLEQATKVFLKLVKEKTSKGYSPDESGKAYQGTENAGRTTDFVPQLLNVITEEEAMRLIEDDAYAMQEKYDGDRRAANADAQGEVFGMNKKGLSVPLPECIAAELRAISTRDGEIRLDAEIIGETLFVFDMHVERGDSLRTSLGWLERMALARQSVSKCQHVKAIPVAITTAEKRALWDKVKAAKGEGLVFKLRNCVVKEGRPNSGGDWLKFVFRARSSFCVLGNKIGKRSANIGVLNDAGEMVSVGHVTIPANATIPSANDVLDVLYHYAYLNGALHIPVYICKRTDVDVSECRSDRLKYKPEDRDEDADA